MLTSRMKHRRKQRPPVHIPAPAPPLSPPTDVLYEIVTTPARFVERIRASKLPEYKRQLLLRLVSRSEQELVNDFIANWHIKHTGSSPIDHDYLPIPDHYLPQIKTVAEFNQYLADYRKKRNGITPVKTIRTHCKPHFVLQDPAITERSSVTIEIAPEIVEIQNGRMAFFLQPNNGYENLVVRITNP